MVKYATTVYLGSDPDSFAIFGCRNLENDAHDEGLWILTSTNVELPENPKMLLENFLLEISLNSNISATMEDFQINDFSTEHFCTCPECSYTMECPTDQGPEEEVVYYDGIDYSSYPQYADYGEKSNSSQFNDNYSDGNGPIYYYYDDDGSSRNETNHENRTEVHYDTYENEETPKIYEEYGNSVMNETIDNEI